MTNTSRNAAVDYEEEDDYEDEDEEGEGEDYSGDSDDSRKRSRPARTNKAKKRASERPQRCAIVAVLVLKAAQTAWLFLAGCPEPPPPCLMT
jgi:FtsZ-interacting cell division protein YlmF